MISWYSIIIYPRETLAEEKKPKHRTITKKEDLMNYKFDISNQQRNLYLYWVSNFNNIMDVLLYLLQILVTEVFQSIVKNPIVGSLCIFIIRKHFMILI